MCDLDVGPPASDPPMSFGIGDVGSNPLEARVLSFLHSLSVTWHVQHGVWEEEYRPIAVLLQLLERHGFHSSHHLWSYPLSTQYGYRWVLASFMISLETVLSFYSIHQ